MVLGFHQVYDDKKGEGSVDSHDQRLGMGKSISRRDFVNGTAVAIGATLVPACSEGGSPPPLGSGGGDSVFYPPLEMGLRGAHPGSFEVAHSVVQGESWRAETLDEPYDLIVVGAGISGLSSAYIYRRDVNPDARILILDNHDDFGGHAKRNEFTVDGKTYLCFGGTMMMSSPRGYPEVAKRMVRELGIDINGFGAFHNSKLYPTLGLSNGNFFDKETFGVDLISKGRRGFGVEADQAPLSKEARDDLNRLFDDEEDFLEGKTLKERREIVESLSWGEYIRIHGRMGSESLTFLQKWTHGNWGIGIDAFPAKIAYLEGYSGFGDMYLEYYDDEEEEEPRHVFWFPDGNASIARLLVQKLIPDVAGETALSGRQMEDVVAARFDYAKLDRLEDATRIRLNCTVTGLRHKSEMGTGDVDVTYVNGDTAKTVSANKVIWAGYHAMLPYVCADVPQEQVAALKTSVRSPLVYTSVLIRNWQSFVKLGLRRAYCPGSFFHSVMLAPPVSFGPHKFSQSPDDPMIVHLQHIPVSPGLPAADQFREGRRQLLELPFEDFERNLRDQLGRMLGPAGFDAAEDILGITVNRWPHGYAYTADPETGDVAFWPELWAEEDQSWVRSRNRIGNIAMAGTDSSSNAMTESAIEEAHRAVHSLMD